MSEFLYWSKVTTIFVLIIAVVIGASINSYATMIIAFPILLMLTASEWGRVLDQEAEARNRRYAAMTEDQRVEYHQRASQRAAYITDANYHAHQAEIILQKQIRDEQRSKKR